ncbi:MAG TPA: oligopeptide/dipeptide ABC transporter ATP-binding protein [Acidimicrobiales bacterium]|jgi:peptide/nickel transport system ATP-binding protein|nr:oligopeptide/dipeptide ABC transporter ATP-binding protein [Acidimicrobiales bacterium]
MSSPRLRVEDLRVTYPGNRPVTALAGVDLTLDAGSCLCVLGESGSGKSTLAHGLIGLLGDAEVAGRIRLEGEDLADQGDWQRVRWRQISIVLSSGTALNPVLRIGDQIAEPLKVHGGASSGAANARVDALLDQVGLGPWAAGRFPRELSTGQRRLAMIAVALVCDAPVVLLDEPTSGLDPQTRRELLRLLGALRDEGRSLLMLTHDLAAARALADEVLVLYRGWVAERGPAAAVLDDPRHPYSFGLLNANPSLGSVKELRGIRGDPPDPSQVAVGCPFVERCTQAIPACVKQRPPEIPPDGEDGPRHVACVRAGLVPVLELRAITKSYLLRQGPLGHQHVAAVAGVDLTVRESEVVGLVGRNGAGKSTLAQICARLLEPDAGEVRLEGTDVLALTGRDLRRARARVQMLFPDPLEALSARFTVGRLVREPLDVQEVGDPEWRDEEVTRLLGQVRLPASAVLDRRTHELSTGQLQRVALARALALAPKLLVADEPVEHLDPSERAKVLQLLKTIQVERGMAMLLVSHDLGVVLRVADRVVVVDGGRVVEEGPSAQILRHPAHPVTRQLLEASGAEIADRFSGLLDPV